MPTFTTIVLTALFGAGALTQGQQIQNPTNKTGVIGLMHAIHSTNDVDTTLAFYQNVFALPPGEGAPKGRVRAMPTKF